MISTDWDDDAGTMKYEKNNYSVAQRSGKYKCCFIFSCGLLFAFVLALLFLGVLRLE